MAYEMQCWWMELTDGTRFQFWCEDGDGVTSPLTSVSGFDGGDHWIVQGPLNQIGASGAPLASGLDCHPLAYVLDDCCYGVPKGNVADVFSVPLI